MGRTSAKKIKTENIENEAPSNSQKLQQQTNEVLRNHFSQSPVLKKQSTPSPIVSPSSTSVYSIIVGQVQKEVESENIRKKIQELEQQLKKMENNKKKEQNNELKYFEAHEQKDEQDINNHKQSKLNEQGEQDIKKDQLFGKHWKQDEMDLLSDGIYCKKMIRAMAESCSYKASHVARRLIEGVYKRDALVKHTFTGKSHGKYCGVLDQTAKKAIIGWVQASIDANMKEIPLGIMPSASASSTAAMEAINAANSPRGARKLGSTFKSGPKRLHTGSHTTPPESPTLPLRKFK